MENFIKKQIIDKVVINVNEINSIINKLNTMIKESKETREINETSKQIVNKLRNLVDYIKESKIVFVEKLIDNILLLTLKFTDINFGYKEANLNLIGGEMINILLNFLSIDQIYLNLSTKEFFNKKWKILENLLILVISLIDKYTHVDKFDISQNLKNMFNFIVLVYSNIDQDKKYKIMPGLVSKIIKLFSLKDVKITSKILNIMINILLQNSEVLFSLLSKRDEIFIKNFISFFEFYFVFNSNIISLSDSKLNKIIVTFTELNLSIIKSLHENKTALNTFCDYNLITDKFEKNFIFINKQYLTQNIHLPDNFYQTASTVYESNKQIEEYLKTNIDSLIQSLRKEEFHKVNANMPNLMYYLTLVLLSDNSLSSIKDDTLSIVQVINTPDIVYIVDNIYTNILLNLLKLKQNIIFEVINTKLNTFSEESLHQSIRKIFINCLYESEINYDYLTFSSIFFDKFLFYLNKTIRKLKKLTVEESIPKSELDALLNEIIQHYLCYLLFIKQEGISKENMMNLKKINIYLVSFLNDYNDQLYQIKPNKLLLIYSLLINTNISLLELRLNKSERNSLLIIALCHYSSNIDLMKYSSILFLMKFTNSNDFGQFIKEHFDFIMNTTINRIIYMKSPSKKAISNFKINTLNFFNSLICILKESENTSKTFYCGEFTKFIKNTFAYIDEFYKEKQFFNLECFLEIIERITEFISESMKEDTFTDCNIFRNIVMRILSLILSNKIHIVYKCIKIYSNLAGILNLLPMIREENANFSTEDQANVLIKSGLGPVMHESWEYFIFIIKRNTNANIIKHLLELLGKVLELNPSFFNSQRVFVDLLPALKDNINNHKNNYDTNNAYTKVVLIFLKNLVIKQNKIFNNTYNQLEELIDLLDCEASEIREILNHIKTK